MSGFGEIASRLLEWIRLGPKTYFSVLISCTVLLYSPPDFLARLRVDAFMKDHGIYVGLAFLSSSVLLVVQGIVSGYAMVPPERNALTRWLRARLMEPPRRSEFDKNEIMRIAQVWTHQAREACEHAHQCLGQAIRQVQGPPNYIVGLLYDKDRELRVATRAFQQRLRADGTEPIAAVQASLVQLLAAYFRCAGWYNRCRRMDATLLPVDRSTDLARMHCTWAAYHRKFMPDVVRLAGRPGYGELSGYEYAAELSDVKFVDDERLSPELRALDVCIK